MNNIIFPTEIWGEIFTYLNVNGLNLVSKCNVDLNRMISPTLSLYKKMDSVKANCDSFNSECYVKYNQDLNFYVSIDGALNIVEPVRIERLWKTVFNYFGTIDRQVERKIEETLKAAFNILTFHFLYPKAIPADDLLRLSLSSYRSVKYLKSNQFSHLFDQGFYLKFKDLRDRIMKENYSVIQR